MTQSPSTQETSETRVSADDLLAVVTEIFLRCGMRDADAALVSDTLVKADLHGVHSHGVLRVPEYVDKLLRHGVDPRGEPRTVTEAGACAVVDGGNGMGQVAARFAMGEAIERALQHGIAAVATRGSNHCGAMAYYAEMALDHDMIGIATTNALPTMAPVGGAERMLGINPLAFAAPAAEETPISYDAAFSGSSHGKVKVYHQKGQRIPEGWALNEHGEPTTDPAEAINGLLVPIGGYKGAGLAMIMGILSSMLSGASYGTELGDMENGPRAGQDGHFFSAIKVAAFEDPARFKQRVDRAIQEIHQVRLAPGYERTYTPGEQEALRAREYRQSGIPVNRETLSGVRRAALGLGIETEPESWGGG